jgi:hypothetical protein
MRESVLGLAGAVAIVALMAGCGSNTGGSAVATSSGHDAVASTTAADSLWDPCTVPDSAIQAIGLDISSKKPNDGDGYLICGWDSSDYALSLYSLQKSLDEVKNNHNLYTGSQPVTVGGRAAVQLLVKSATPECDIAVAVPVGVVLFGVQSWSLTDNTPPCDKAEQMASSLEPHIPGGK